MQHRLMISSRRLVSLITGEFAQVTRPVIMTVSVCHSVGCPSAPGAGESFARNALTSSDCSATTTASSSSSSSRVMRCGVAWLSAETPAVISAPSAAYRRHVAA